MAAVPKNKITSVERGKRRAGQLAQMQLKKNPKQAKVPLNKRGLVAQMFSQMSMKFDEIISHKK